MRVKICGITSAEDALAAADAGADLLGFIFYPPSPRYIPPEQAAALADTLRARGNAPGLVGVFVDADPPEVWRVIHLVGLDLVQLHGSEPPTEVRALQPRVYKAIRPKNRGDSDVLVATYAGVLPPADPQTAAQPSFLVDAYHPWSFGGTGTSADWHAARLLAQRYPVLLAGGLTPETVADAIAHVRPWGVDVSSGVEVSPGKKDHTRVRAFIQAARAAPVSPPRNDAP